MIATKTKELIDSEKAMDIVQDFMHDELGHTITVGQPCHVVGGLQSAWSVPLVLTSPGYGVVGLVGTVIAEYLGHTEIAAR